MVAETFCNYNWLIKLRKLIRSDNASMSKKTVWESLFMALGFQIVEIIKIGFIQAPKRDK